jgi:vacuolar-type H+-ATPase subunit E/Vma4
MNLSKNVVSNSQQYRLILTDLIVEGCLLLLEEEVTIQCRKEDINLVEAVIGDVRKKHAFFHVFS